MGQRTDQAFAGYHPAVTFAFFIGAIVMGFFFVHPFFVCVSLFSSALYYRLLTGRKGARYLLGMTALFVCVSLINPFLNNLGDTVLFTYFGDRRFTLEALLYGASSGALFVSVLLWFACYNLVMTSDKFIYLFGRCIPSVSLLLSMVLRLVPSFKRKTIAIAGARKGVGKAPDSGEKRDKLRNSMDVLSVLTSWALEGAVVTADSMKSRGYGSGQRSHFSLFRFSRRDIAALGALSLSLLFVIAGVARGGAGITFYPSVSLNAGIDTAVGAAGYALFLLLPSAVHLWEEATWHILRSRI